MNTQSLRLRGSNATLSQSFNIIRDIPGEKSYTANTLDVLIGDLEDTGLSNSTAVKFANAVETAFTMVSKVEDWIEGYEEDLDTLDGSQRSDALDTDLETGIATSLDDETAFYISS